jgi:hypothetical protein
VGERNLEELKFRRRSSAQCKLRHSVWVRRFFYYWRPVIEISMYPRVPRGPFSLGGIVKVSSSDWDHLSEVGRDSCQFFFLFSFDFEACAIQSLLFITTMQLSAKRWCLVWLQIAEVVIAAQ